MPASFSPSISSVLIANSAVYSQNGTAIQLISGALGSVTVVGNVGAGGLLGAGAGYVEGGGLAADWG